MKQTNLSIHADITKAHSLSASFYRDTGQFHAAREAIFSRSWQCVGLKDDVQGQGVAQPFTLMDGFLNEPLVLVRDQKEVLRCLSNVCTHRGNILVTSGGPCDELKCRYHGRRFSLDGTFKSMPEFSEAIDFPAPQDNLPEVPLHTFGNLLFTSIDPGYAFEDWIAPVRERLSWLPLETFQHAPEYSQTYTLEAHWALYIDNYLEGFHIPFEYRGQNGAMGPTDYRYETFEFANLQMGMTNDGEQTFDIPPGHQDHGKAVAAYYFWLFPNLMLNVYPWGLTLNIVEPLTPSRTRIRFESFIWKPEYYNEQHRDLLHITELEDGSIVESVQRGVNSRLYKSGRLSPKMEVAVHHFHSLIAREMENGL